MFGVLIKQYYEFTFTIFVSVTSYNAYQERWAYTFFEFDSHWVSQTSDRVSKWVYSMITIIITLNILQKILWFTIFVHIFKNRLIFSFLDTEMVEM